MIFKSNNVGGGIYAIVNSINGKFYVGRTINFRNRFINHVSDFKLNKTRYTNSGLISDMGVYGYDSFNFITLEECPVGLQVEKELFWILRLKATDDAYGYNLRIDLPSGMVTHPSTSIKISERLKKEWANGVRDNHSEKLKFNWKNNTNRKDAQSKLLTKIKTKYKYFVSKDGFEVSVNYEGLKNLNLQTALSNFHRKKSDDVLCKGYRIVRININE
jgi:group I intron endonuclease